MDTRQDAVDSTLSALNYLDLEDFDQNLYFCVQDTELTAS